MYEYKTIHTVWCTTGDEITHLCTDFVSTFQHKVMSDNFDK